MNPIRSVSDETARNYITIKFRPITEKGVKLMTEWFMIKNWDSLDYCITAHDMAETFHNSILSQYHKFFPEKN